MLKTINRRTGNKPVDLGKDTNPLEVSAWFSRAFAVEELKSITKAFHRKRWKVTEESEKGIRFLSPLGFLTISISKV